jgi:uncharacterized repeat protein (TIGR01451 family)
VRNKLAALLVAVMLTMAWAVVVLADAGNPILGTITPTATFNSNGTVTVSVQGQWNWLSHNSDCNFDRAATGVAMIWNDPTETGYLLTKGTVSAQVGIKSYITGAWVGFGTGTDPNPLDAMVHPVDIGNVPVGLPGVPSQVLVNPTPPASGIPTAANATAWKGGCGREPLTNADAYIGHPYGSWGYQLTYSHIFRRASDISTVCANFYDVHGGGTVASGKFQLVNGVKEITVNQNGDNSISTNMFNVNDGRNCIRIVAPNTPAIVTTATNAVLPNGKISDSAVLSGSNSGADIGDIVFKVYTSSDCTTGLVDTKTVTAVTGNGTYLSGDVTPTAAGTYYWLVSFLSSNKGAGGNMDAIGICGDISGQLERSVVSNLTYEKTVSTSGATGTFSHNVTAAPGDTLYWQITITNTNTVPATGVTVLDDLSAALVANSNANATLAGCPAGNPSPTCFSYTTGVPAAGQSEIKWTGIGVPAKIGTTNGTTVLTFHVTLNSTISAAVTLDNVVVSPTDNCAAPVDPALHPECITTTEVPQIVTGKTPDIQTVVTGTSATFTITVTNTGNVALTNVHVDDAATVDCAKTAAQIATMRGTPPGSTLAVGASFQYTCTATPTEVGTGFTNSATSYGTPPTGPAVFDTDTAVVNVIAPAISITKDPATQSVTASSTATFTITVTNIGDTPLTSVSVADLLSLDCTRLATNTPPNDLGSLAVGAHATYTCTATAAEVGTTGFTNSATGCGQPSVGPPVCATDTAIVTISALHSNQDFVPNDTAILSGLQSPSGGTLTVALFNGATCDSTPVTGNQLLSQSFTVNANGSFTTTNGVKLSTLIGSTSTGGTYSWKITYSGDTTNAAINGGCGDEHFVVTNN